MGFYTFRMNSKIHDAFRIIHPIASHNIISVKYPPPSFFCWGCVGRLNLFICIQTHLTLKMEYLPAHQYMVDELACFSEKHLHLHLQHV